MCMQYFYHSFENLKTHVIHYYNNYFYILFCVYIQRQNKDNRVFQNCDQLFVEALLSKIGDSRTIRQLAHTSLYVKTETTPERFSVKIFKPSIHNSWSNL